MKFARKVGAILFFVELTVKIVELINEEVENKFGNSKTIEDEKQ